MVNQVCDIQKEEKISVDLFLMNRPTDNIVYQYVILESEIHTTHECCFWHRVAGVNLVALSQQVLALYP